MFQLREGLQLIDKMMEVKIKKYINPEIEVVEISVNDVITTSPGTETPWYEENDGIWEMGINL